jgi:hypothetical protein
MCENYINFLISIKVWLLLLFSNSSFVYLLSTTMFGMFCSKYLLLFLTNKEHHNGNIIKIKWKDSCQLHITLQATKANIIKKNLKFITLSYKEEENQTCFNSNP